MMKKPGSSSRKLVVLFMAGLCASCGDPLSPGEEHQFAAAAAESWAVAHPTGWNFDVEGSELPRQESWSRACNDSPQNGFVALRVEAPKTRLTLYFRCSPGAPNSVPAMRDAFSFVVLEELPHGLTLRNWSFSVLTPSSSFSSGVVISQSADGRLSIAINTTLYAVSGRSDRESCVTSADAPSDPDCYVLRVHRIPLAMSVRTPIDGAMFK